ncbi:MAG: phenylalanine--tRNA ligase subunit beta [Finegoldia sp.]|nr:phenylalanine--tRNA ligase subunit beta [Finegoldia sp.]
MLLPLGWVEDFVEVKESTKEITDRLSETGNHVESVIDFSKDLNDNIVVAKIKEIKKHPKADKLSVVTLDLGDEDIEVITGAKNIYEGMVVSYAKVGASLPGGIKLENKEFMGINSPGMLNSYEELGFPANIVDKKSKNGLANLSDDLKLGDSIKDALAVNKPVLELEITPNRSDCLSIIGMAREYGASFSRSISYPSLEVKETVDDIGDYFKGVEVETDKCNSYVARVVKDVVIKDSPQWMKNRLIQAGVRPVNNIVDITNYVMLEMGQPIHAYDLEDIGGKKILVRNAQEGEKLTTLDESERKLSKDDMLICDQDGPVGLAGVMGGLNSEIKDNTKTILIESAAFDADTIRYTSRRQNLRTEASTRFEKGISPVLCHKAMLRVLHLIEKTDSGKVVGGSFVEGLREEDVKEESIEFSISKINGLLGYDFSEDYVIDLLKYLEIEVEKLGDDKYLAKVPYFRSDLSLWQDLAEEVVRIFAYSNIKPKALVGKLKKGEKSKEKLAIEKCKQTLYGLNCMEALTYSFISPKAYKLAEINVSKDDIIELINPLGEDYSVMRTTIVPNILNVLKNNENQRIDDLCVYELGNTFHVDDGQRTEKKQLVIGMYGNYDFYDLKNMVINLFNEMGIYDIDFVKEAENSTYHAGRCAKMVYDKKEIGYLGEISYEVKDNYDFSHRVYLAEVDFAALIDSFDFKDLYNPISKYPTVERDIAIVVDQDLESKLIEREIRDNSDGLIIDLYLFDEYKGKNVAEGKKSLAYRMVYQAKDKTLRDEYIDSIQKKILDALYEKYEAELRS